jgi:hypothetical protein
MKTLYESILSTSKSGKYAYIPEMIAEKIHEAFPKMSIELDDGPICADITCNENLLYDKSHKNGIQKLTSELKRIGVHVEFKEDDTNESYLYKWMNLGRPNDDYHISLFCSAYRLFRGCEYTIEGKMHSQTTISCGIGTKDPIKNQGFMRFFNKMGELYNVKI